MLNYKNFLTKKGVVKTVVCPNLFYIHLVSSISNSGQTVNYPNEFFELNKQIAEFYSESSNCQYVQNLNSVELKGLYACNDANIFKRVKIVDKHSNRNREDEVSCFFVDFGERKQISVSKILNLPSNIAVFKHLAVEVVICDLVPTDDPYEWPEKVTDKARELLLNKEMTLKCLFGTNTTIFATKAENIIQLSHFDMPVTNFTLPDLYTDPKNMLASSHDRNSSYLVKAKSYFESKLSENDRHISEEIPDNYLKIGPGSPKPTPADFAMPCNNSEAQMLDETTIIKDYEDDYASHKTTPQKNNLNTLDLSPKKQTNSVTISPSPTKLLYKSTNLSSRFAKMAQLHNTISQTQTDITSECSQSFSKVNGHQTKKIDSEISLNSKKVEENKTDSSLKNFDEPQKPNTRPKISPFGALSRKFANLISINITWSEDENHLLQIIFKVKNCANIKLDLSVKGDDLLKIMFYSANNSNFK